jgi:hypothetical protein
LVDDIAANFGVVGTQAIQEDMHDWNGDWDILYPFSAVSKILFLFIEIWRFAFAFRPLIQKMYCVL